MEHFTKAQWLSLFAMVPALAMAFMDQSILPVALPAIQQDFGSKSTALQWTVNSYLLATAVFMLIGGKLGDRIGYRKTYLIGMVAFTFFSALCGLSPNVEFLIVARAFQGVGGALMFPSQSAIIAAIFPLRARGRATGVFVSTGAFFLVIAPFVGGYLTEMLSWHWIFWINLPLAAIGFFLSFLLLPSTPPGKGKIDLLGFIYFAIVSNSLVIFFMQARDWGWTSTKNIALAVLAIVFSFFLFRREKKAEHPFLDLSLFKLPIFTSINVSVSITQFVLMITVFRTVYLEEILGYTPAETGLISSLSSLPVLCCSMIAGFLSDKISPRLPIVLGYFLLIFSFFWLGFFSTPPLSGLFVALFIFSIGIPFILTPSYSTTLSAVPNEKVGVAFGMVATLRMLSGTIGLSLIYLFVSVEQSIHLPLVGMRLATIASFSSVHLILGCLLIVAFIVTMIIRRRKSAHHLPSSPAEGWD